MRTELRGNKVWRACLFLCCLTAAGCRCSPEENQIVAWVNDAPISFVEFWGEFKSRYEGASDPGSLQPDVLAAMKGGVLSDMIRQRLLLQEARRREIRVPPEALAARIEEIRREYPGQAFEKVLLSHQQDEEQFRADVEKQMMLEELYREVVEGIGEVTDEEIGAYYDENLDEFLVPETVRMRQILVKDDVRAAAILKRVRKGEDFAALAGEYSQGSTGKTAGGLETYRKGELPEVLEQIAFTAKKGKVLGPVETYYGYHLIEVEDTEPAHLPPLEEVREEIERELRQQRQEERYESWVKDLVETSRIRVHDSLREAILVR